MNHRFAALAEEFLSRLRSATLTSTTEIRLVYHCVDAAGNALSPVKRHIDPRTTALIPGDQNVARQIVAHLHLNAICRSIDSFVCCAPEGLVQKTYWLRDFEGFFMFTDGCPQIPVQIVGFDLEIEEMRE